MDPASLIAFTIIISVSGVMSPGPLTASAIAVGTKKFARGGFLVAFGHMLFEFPYVLVLASFYSAIGVFLMDLRVSIALTVIVASFILFFSYILIKDGVEILRSGAPKTGERKIYSLHPVLVGFLLTGLNPYFLLWWLSVGLPLIQASYSMGLPILLLMYASHIWMDYLWFTLMGFAGESSTKILKSRGYGALLIILGFMLALFAVDMSLRTFLDLSLLHS